MIYDKNTGQRMTVDGTLKPFYEKMIADNPDFDTTGLNVVVKPEYMRSVVRMRGNAALSDNENDFSNPEVRKVPPPPMSAVPDGYYINDKGQKFQVIYTEVPPVIQNGVPVFAYAKNIVISDRMCITKEEVDKAVFFYAFSKQISKGAKKEDEYEGAIYEFAKPRVVAAERLSKLNAERQLENEILIEGVCMAYDKVKAILPLLGIASKGYEETDRLALFDMVSASPDKRKQYETAKRSVLSELPKFDLTNTSKLVRAAKTAKVLVEEGGMWVFVKSPVLKEKIVEVSGQKADEKIFALSEYLTENPALVEDIKKHVE